jgi:thiamine biosynthesis lipoprotein
MTVHPSDIGAHSFAHQAMATEFEIYCVHPGREYAQQAVWAAFDLLDRMESELSRFIENSDISRINALAPGESTRVNRWTMQCLEIALAAFKETAGAFDISLGTGLDSLQLDSRASIVRATSRKVVLDLGGIGKGYAVDRMAEVLREWDIHQALIHGGYSSVLAMDAPAGFKGWPLTMSDAEGAPFRDLQAKRQAFSASGIRKGDHILDPRNRKPVRRRLAAWAAAELDSSAFRADSSPPEPAGDPPSPSADPPETDSGAHWVRASPSAAAEAFSTAFMILSAGEVTNICDKFPGLEAWLLEPAAPPIHISSKQARKTK